MRMFAVLSIAALGVFLCGAAVAGEAKGKTTKTTDKADPKKKVTYAVVQVGDADAKVVTSEDLADLEKQQKEQAKEAKDAAKKKNAKKVEVKKLTVIKKEIKTEKEAEKVLKDYLDKQKKTGKDKTATDKTKK